MSVLCSQALSAENQQPEKSVKEALKSRKNILTSCRETDQNTNTEISNEMFLL